MEVRPNEGAVTSFIIYEKELMQKQNPTANVGHPNVILSTQEIEKAYDQMKENGVEVGELQVMPYGKMFSFKDQDGNAYIDCNFSNIINHYSNLHHLEYLLFHHILFRNNRYSK